MFSAFAGLDNLGYGVARGCPGAFIAGGSERDATGQEAFRRRHRFVPMDDHFQVPDHMLGAVYAVVSGAPCVAFSSAGHQLGSTDIRGSLYENQIPGFIRAQIPVILLEQVPECRSLLAKDRRSQALGSSPQQRVVTMLQEAGYHVPCGDDSLPGQIIRATAFGSAIDRERLFTLAIRADIWELAGDRFQWPQPGSAKPRTTRSILDRVPDERYICRQDNSISFDAVHTLVRDGRSHLLWVRKNHSNKTMGQWDDPDRIYSLDSPLPSPTARGNTRWFEMIGPEGQSWRRRLSPSEVARAMGIDDQLVAHLGERGGYSLVGNAVPLEVAEALGQTLQLLVVEPEVETRTRLWLENYPENKTLVFFNMIPIFISRQSGVIQTITLLVTTCHRPPRKFSYPDPFAAPPPLLPSPSFGIVGPP